MTDLLTPSALLEIEERAGKATAGEWHVDGFHTSAVIHEEKPRIFNRICETDSEHFPNANWRHDAAFIAHARTDIPALLQHISALQEQIERAREPSGKAMLAHAGPTIADAIAAAREEGAKEMRERIWDALHETMPPNRVMSLKCDDKIEDGAQIGWMTCNDTFLDIVRELPLPTTPQA